GAYEACPRVRHGDNFARGDRAICGRGEARARTAGLVGTMNEKIKKASRHTTQNEGLIFEKSSPGKRAFELPPLDVAAAEPAKVPGACHRREGVQGFPEVSEIEVLRHFTRLSTWNHAIDLGMYPLGSCTMKYNPRVNEFVARLEGIATEHPYQ